MIRGYAIEVHQLAANLGGGFVGYAPQLKGCLADGESPAEAERNLADAIDCWLEAARESGLPIPLPAVAADA